MNCVVALGDKGCEIWNGAQLHTGDQMAVAAVLGSEPQDVKINTLCAGGSFGRRANPNSDYVVEAASIARGFGRERPLKLVWTREDDTRAGYFRPMYLHTLKGGLDGQGRLAVWQQRIVGQSIAAGTAFEQVLLKDGIDGTSVEGAANLPYRIPDLEVGICSVAARIQLEDVGVRMSVAATGSMRVFTEEFRGRIGPALINLANELAEHLGSP